MKQIHYSNQEVGFPILENKNIWYIDSIDVNQLFAEKKQEIIPSSLQACFVITHSSGDKLM